MIIFATSKGVVLGNVLGLVFFATSGILKSYKHRVVLLQWRHVELGYPRKKTLAVLQRAPCGQLDDQDGGG